MARQKHASSPPHGFGPRLLLLRQECRLSRAELASKAQVSEDLVARIETRVRESIGSTSLFRLANALEVRPYWLWRGEEPRTPGVTEKRLIKMVALLDVIADEHLARALAESKYRYHRSIVVVASSFARSGEHHSTAGWWTRLDEIAEKLSPLLDGLRVRTKRIR